jgi:KDO2-lipid IV(A) lauroyltransferase
VRCGRPGRGSTSVGEPLEPPELFDWFVAQREKLGLRVLPLDAHVTTELLAAVRRGDFIALLADRDIVGDGVDVELFGERTKLPGGPAVIALRTGAPLIACAVYMRPHGRHFIVVRPPLDTARRARLREDTARVTQELAHELEWLVRLAPEQWHVFQPNWPADLPAGDQADLLPGDQAGERAGPAGAGTGEPVEARAGGPVEPADARAAEPAVLPDLSPGLP